MNCHGMRESRADAKPFEQKLYKREELKKEDDDCSTIAVDVVVAQKRENQKETTTKGKNTGR
ncbi:hypothetical protein F511_22090 [Dorcoceras hygrometricum]|uniref:Uncharacterized protein n=1 Tax=Dorcoceras hygrometricum TaxID=472368 RepID=A0A2Z7CNT9_9LAMI|nr:hypothetical protein F511_22090 [Dorcoceras hygrometricum]